MPVRTKFLYPGTPQEASRLLLHAEEAVPIAGGTDLSILMKKKALQPPYVVNLMGLGWNYRYIDEQVIHIGATSTFTEILSTAFIRETVPVLYQACAQIGSLQCRSMATIGGNLCSAVPSADSATPLLALDARVKLVSADETRTVPLNEFFKGPRKTVLKRGELMQEIQIPVPPQDSLGTFLKFGRRKALTLSVVNVAVHATPNGLTDGIPSVRIALGAVAPTPVRATRAEEILAAKPATSDQIDKAVAIALTEIAPISDLRASKEYRLDISRILLQRALLEIVERAHSPYRGQYPHAL